MNMVWWILTLVSTVSLCKSTSGAFTCKSPYPKCSAKMDLVLMMDSSGSIGYADWELVLQFMKDIVNSFSKIGEGGLKMSVIIYSNNATVLWDLSNPVAASRTLLLQTISRIELVGGFTNMVDAIIFAKTDVFDMEGNRPTAPNCAVLMTDGRVGFQRSLLEIASAQLQQVAQVFSIGVTTEVNLTHLAAVASNGSQGVFFTNDFLGLVKLVPDIIQAICPEDNLIQSPEECLGFKPEVSNTCLDCMCAIQSTLDVKNQEPGCKMGPWFTGKCDPPHPQVTGCVMDRQHCRCGPYLITEQQFLDCKELTELPFDDFHACAANNDCTRQCLKAYMGEFALSCTGKQKAEEVTCKDFARMLYGGKEGCKKRKTQQFGNSVAKCAGEIE